MRRKLWLAAGGAAAFTTAALVSAPDAPPSVWVHRTLTAFVAASGNATPSASDAARTPGPPPPAHAATAPTDRSDALPLRTGNALDAIAGQARAPAPPSHPAVVTVARVEAGSPAGALSYASPLQPPGSSGNPLAAPPPAIAEIPGLREAIAAYRSGDIAAGDAEAQQISDPLARTAAQWANLRLQPRFDRMRAFLAAHPDWPDSSLRNRLEEALLQEQKPPVTVLSFFTESVPQTVSGRLALLRSLKAEGREAEASALARRIWREDNVSLASEAAFLKDYANFLLKSDHKFRSDRYAYKENTAASLRAAALAGPDIVALAKARDGLNEKLIAALPAELKKDPSLLLRQIQKLRREKKFAEAGQLMLTAPTSAVIAVDGDEWWTERRLIARKLLDLGDAEGAYKVAANHTAESNENRMEAEFHAGWIALRFLHDPARAKAHFDAGAGLAKTPQSITRAAYWQGRTAEAANDAAATGYYQTAASHSGSYYGQLARMRLGRSDLRMRIPARIALGEDRAEAIRVVELLDTLDQKDLATPLAIAAARKLDDEAQIAALADVYVRAGNAGMTLAIGKTASQRGFSLDELAFPIFGVPAFEPLARSADKSMVYAIARQESAFAPQARSSAGAKGLMQMLTSTARGTAKKWNVPFDEERLMSDGAFNAQLGAAHLGDLLAEYRNSNILTFAAYNAGGKRVAEWIAANGDPRSPDVDPVDWIERIPITETRNYVQRVVENLEVYRVRLGEREGLAIDETLRQASAKR